MIKIQTLMTKKTVYLIKIRTDYWFTLSKRLTCKPLPTDLIDFTSDNTKNTQVFQKIDKHFSQEKIVTITIMRNFYFYKLKCELLWLIKYIPCIHGILHDSIANILLEDTRKSHLIIQHSDLWILNIINHVLFFFYGSRNAWLR